MHRQSVKKPKALSWLPRTRCSACSATQRSALSRVGAVVDHVAAEGDCVPGALGLNHSFQGRPVGVDVREDQKLHRAPILGKADLPG